VTVPTPSNSHHPSAASTPPVAASETLRRTDSAALPPDGTRGGESTQAERTAWVGRTHWKHYAGRLVLWLAAVVLVAIGVGWIAESSDALGWRGAFWIDVAVFGATGAWVLGGVAWRIFSCRYRLTSQRLFVERGILSQTIDQTELVRVDDVQIRKSLLDRVFGLGSILVASTDATDRQLTIIGVREPDRLAELIRANTRDMRRGSLYVESI
jgi:membrane protein YdbS with pleckstrin-like domain